MKGFIASAVFLVCLLGGWEAIVAYAGPAMLPHVWTLVEESFSSLAYQRILASRREMPPGLAPHIAATATRALIVCAGGLLLGIGIAVVGALHRGVRAGLTALIDFNRAIPPLLFVPIMVLFMGIGEVSLLMSATVYAVAAVATYADAALRSIDSAYLDGARVAGMGRTRTALHLLVPYAFYSIRGGVQITISIAVGIVLVAEYYIGGLGLGRVLTIGLYSNSSELIFVALFWACALVVVLSAVYETGLWWVFKTR